MSACWIIDGYNVILRLGSTGRLEDGELARRRQVLEEMVTRFGRHQGICPLVVYDGLRLPGAHAGGGRGDNLEVTFVEPPSEADDLIHHRAAGRRREGRKVRVVTSDEGLAWRVRNEGAVVISAEAFGQRLVELGQNRKVGAGDADGMADIEAHFLALHHEEERRRVTPAPPARVIKRQNDAAQALCKKPADSREEHRLKGRLRQQRRLQAQRRGREDGRRRRH
jgi:predicted RNA-binding protein with PIN domain